MTPLNHDSWSFGHYFPRKGPRVLLRLIATIVALSALTFSTVAAKPDATGTVPTGRILWGAYVPGAPFDPSLLDAFESQSGKKMSIVHWGQPWIMNGASQAFQTKQFQAVRNRGSISMLSWGSWDVGKGPNQPAFRLAKVADGQYDAYITQWANAARAWGQPFFLRFDWEMNGFWQFPWAEQMNANQPGDFVRAWRHVHDIFAQQSATNAAWVWCPNISGLQTTPLANLYPGDSYVDWTCMDGYNMGTDQGNQWQQFNQLFFGSSYNGHHNTYEELRALAPNTPIMIGETASSEHGGSKSAWISDMLFQVPKSLPQVRAVVWMDWNAGDPKLSWPLSSSTAARNAFAKGIAAADYATNQFASQSSLVAIPSAAPVPAADVPVAPAPVETPQMPIDPSMLSPSGVSPVPDPVQSAPEVVIPDPTAADPSNADPNGTVNPDDVIAPPATDQVAATAD